MTCAIVLSLRGPFAAIDDRYGITKAAALRHRSGTKVEALLLLTSGFDLISEAERRRLAEYGCKVVDAAPEYAAIKADHDFANDQTLWRGEPFHELCFLRWLVLERYFGSQTVLAYDADVVWRTDPAPLLESWKAGGSFVCMYSPCLTYISSPDWYAAYRTVLERLSRDRTFGSERQTGPHKGLYHDNALIKHSIAKGLMPNDAANLGQSFGRYFIHNNPIGIGVNETKPLTFTQKDDAEFIDGRVVPFWHFQSAFSQYVSLALMVPALTGRTHFRIPYEARKASLPGDLMVEFYRHLHARLQKGTAEIKSDSQRAFDRILDRGYQYERMFDGGFAMELFTEQVWWRPGTWAQ